MSKIQELKQEYSEYPDQKKICENADEFLLKKWQARVPKGWYGFALGQIPLLWVNVIDDYLTYLSMMTPDFEIHQIKVKFGGVRFYVGLNEQNIEIEKEISELESWLYSKDLVY